MDTTFIYALCEPDTGEIRYIGKADNPHKRLHGHTSSRVINGKTHRSCWIRSLVNQNKSPVLKIIDEVPVNHWQALEAAYIDFCRERGMRLVNIADGGQGTSHWGHTFNRGRKQTPESIEKRMSKTRGDKHWTTRKSYSGETRQKMRLAKLGKRQTLEHASNAARARTFLKSEVRFQKVLRFLFEGKNQTEIAKILAVSPAAICAFLKSWRYSRGTQSN